MHAPEGRIKPHIRPFLEALASHGVTTILIVTTDQIRDVETTDLVDLVGGLYVRQNEGI
jgi:hypothetical protein